MSAAFKRAVPRAAAIIIAAVAFAGCGGGGASAAAGTTGTKDVCPRAYSANACEDGCNPCTRLTDAQVAAAVGLPAVAGQWNSDACTWDFYDDQGDISLEVGLDINTDYGTFEELCAPPSDPDGGITVTPVPGVGDEACFITTSFGALGSFEIDFLKGCSGYAITVSGPAGSPPPFSAAMAQAAEKALALDAVPNL